MTTRFPRLAFLATVVIAALPGLARANGSAAVALDYQSSARGCPTADRFGDEVAARVGYVPWQPDAATAIRIRIVEDAADFVGTIERPDGGSKVLRAKDCAQLTSVLVSAVAVALDPAPGAPPPPPTPVPVPVPAPSVAPPDDDRVMVDVRLVGDEQRKIEFGRVMARGSIRDFDKHHRVASTVSVETFCQLPCTARVPNGSQSLVFRDLDTDSSVTVSAPLYEHAAFDVRYISHAAERESAAHHARIGSLIGTIAAGVVFGMVLEHYDLPRSAQLFDPLVGFVTGGILVGGITYAAEGHPDDEVRLAPRPLLPSASLR